jgi:adenylate cyclase
MAEARVQRRLPAILAADAARCSWMMGAYEPSTLAALRAMWAVRFNSAVAVLRGRLVKMMETVKDKEK